MASNLESFEVRLADFCDLLLSVKAQANRLKRETWSDADGAAYEGVYNAALTPPDFKPLLNGYQGKISKNQANNAISAIQDVITAIETKSEFLALVAEFSPNVTNQG